MKTLGKEFFAELSAKATAAPRKRAHFNLHKSVEEDFHRLCIAAEPDTYIRPHRHSRKEAWELLVILKGTADVLIFDDNGTLKERVTLSESGAERAIEIDQNTFHGFIPHEKGSIVLEVKRGPYLPTQELDFGAWSPPEGDEKVPQFLARLKTLRVGEKLS
ncbi:MAG: hypothetical protein A2X49_00430 [Lentisphaerae bacterium GWF2_52_8]|nr:MAG: hypothetical protein A2X49_00430 [Lentisphaerae bacterium GWF2_52_8]